MSLSTVHCPLSDIHIGASLRTSQISDGWQETGLSTTPRLFSAVLEQIARSQSHVLCSSDSCEASPQWNGRILHRSNEPARRLASRSFAVLLPGFHPAAPLWRMTCLGSTFVCNSTDSEPGFSDRVRVRWDFAVFCCPNRRGRSMAPHVWSPASSDKRRRC